MIVNVKSFLTLPYIRKAFGTTFVRYVQAFQELWAFSLKELEQLEQPKWCSVKPRHRFAYHSLDYVKIHKYTKFEPNNPSGSRVMSVFTNWSQIFNWCSAKSRQSNNAVMHQNIPCGSRVISVLANCRRTDDGRTHTVIIVQTCGLCNSITRGSMVM